MRKKFFITMIILLLNIFSLVSAYSKDEKMGLKECYELALARSEKVQFSDQEIKLARVQFLQAVSTFVPKIDFRFTEILQDDHANASSTGSGNVSNTFTLFSRPEAAFTISQNLFQGLKEMHAIRAAGLSDQYQLHRKAEVERLLFGDVGIVFFTIAHIELDIKTTQKMIQTMKSLSHELRERVSLGKTRESDLLSQEADLSLLEADLLKKKGDRQVAYEALSFLTGLHPQPSIDWQSFEIQNPKTLEEYLMMAQNRPDILAALDSVKLAKADIKIKKSDFLPTANATANLYAYRPGFQKDINWDATFRVNVPLFNLSTIANVKEAKLKAKQSEILADEKKRLVQSEVKKNFEAYQAAIAEFQKYRIAVQKSERSLAKQHEDLGLNLITPFEMLQTQKNMLEAMRKRDLAQSEIWSDWANLILSVGRYQ